MTGALYLGTVIPLLFLILFIRGENRILLLFLMWGLTAVLPASLINEWLARAADLCETDVAVFAVPMVEELLKALPLIFVFIRPKQLKGDSILFAAMAAGIGYSIHENFMYVAALQRHDIMAVFVSIIRSLSTSVMHGSTVVIIGLACLALREHGKPYAALLAGTYLTAISLHGFFNYLMIGNSSAGIALLIPIGLFLFLLQGILNIKKRDAALYW